MGETIYDYNLSILEKKILFYNVFKLVSIDQCN